MARDPGSLWSPLVENGRQGSYTKTQFIVHSTGDRATAAAIFNYFNQAPVVVESTFVVGRGPEDPTRQLLDSSSGADANLGANQRAISVEVVGTADDDYTDWQVSEIIRLGRWAKANHPIEPRICPTHNTSGFGWHVMFGSPGPWTPVAKSCPGNLRIQRLRERIFPAIFANPIEENDDDMPTIVNVDGGGIWLLSPIGYHWVAEPRTVESLARAGAKSISISKPEHENWVGAQNALKASSGPVTVTGSFPTAGQIGDELASRLSA